MNRVILLEGLPGTGKATNSYRLFEQLIRNGWDVRWLHGLVRAGREKAPVDDKQVKYMKRCCELAVSAGKKGYDYESVFPGCRIIEPAKKAMGRDEHEL